MRHPLVPRVRPIERRAPGAGAEDGRRIGEAGEDGGKHREPLLWWQGSQVESGSPLDRYGG